jgi:shikimate kinase
MGAGKSTVGKKLASKLGYDFFDTDKMLESKYKIGIDSFFNKYGEELFRKLEHQCLIETFKFNNCVISTGGGLPCYFDAMQKINRVGISIYLQLSDKAIYNRLINSKQKRPLLNGKNEQELLTFINAKLEDRKLFYEQASIVVPALNINADKLIEVLE